MSKCWKNILLRKARTDPLEVNCQRIRGGTGLRTLLSPVQRQGCHWGSVSTRCSPKPQSNFQRRRQCS
jgi:hypothetical protein